MIDRQTIDNIYSTAKILDVVQEFVQLRRAGSNYKGCCPFHNEKTPSFSVSPARNIYKCFGCGESGGPVNFIMRHEGLSYPEALRWLASRYHIVIEEKEFTKEEQEANDRRESLFVVSSFAQRTFAEQLLQSEEGSTIGYAYFKARGIEDLTIRAFGLGYAFQQRNAFTEKAIQHGFNEEYLIATGLSIKGERGVFDRFAGRVIFPIHSIGGKVIAFGGRILGEKTDKLAKYLNSPESEIYHKSNVLYGLYQAKQEITKKQNCILVEGYMDVLGLYQTGIRNVVASCGTSLTAEHIRLIKRFMPENPTITLIYDGDSAGIKAALKGIDMILTEDINIRMVLLPEGEDPDSFAKKHGSDETQKYLTDNATDFIQFKTNYYLKEAKDDPIKRAELITNVLHSIAKIPQAIKRETYLQDLAKRLDMNISILNEGLQSILHQGMTKPISISPKPSDQVAPEPKEASIVALPIKPFDINIADKAFVEALVLYGDKNFLLGDTQYSIAEYILDECEFTPKDETLKIIYDEYQRLYRDGNSPTIEHFVQYHDPEVNRYAADFIPMEEKYAISKRIYGNAPVVNENDKLLDMIPSILFTRKLDYMDIELSLLNEELSRLEQEEGEISQEQEEKFIQIQKEIMRLNRLQVEIGKITGRVLRR